MSVVKHWKKFPREVVDGQSLGFLKISLNWALSDLIYMKMFLITAGGLD